MVHHFAVTELFNSDTQSISGLSGGALPDGDL